LVCSYICFVKFSQPCLCCLNYKIQHCALHVFLSLMYSEKHLDGAPGCASSREQNTKLTVLFFFFRSSALGQVQYTNDANVLCTVTFYSVAIIGCANLPNRYSALWPVTHAQTRASYSALYRFGRLSLSCH